MDVGTKGERTAEVLWYATRTRERRQEMLGQINHWLQEFGVALEARLERLGQSNQYRVLFRDPASQLKINLADVGFGASQVLPIIVQGLYSRPGTLLLVEQPEIHLHPRAQATLGDLLVDIAKRGDRRLIVETHSDHVLGRVQRRIAEEKISRSEVAIYYFNPTPEGTQIREVTVDELGQFEEFPEGFFEESFQEAVAHSKAMRNRIAHGA
jgi:predicted ATPase